MVVVVVVVLCRESAEVCTQAALFKDAHRRGAMAQHQLDRAGLQEVDFEMCSIRVIALTWTM